MKTILIAVALLGLAVLAVFVVLGLILWGIDPSDPEGGE